MDNGFVKDKRIGLIAAACMGWGIFAHGAAMFGKFSFHDDAAWFNGVGETYELGRWGLGALGEIFEKIFGSLHYSTPAFNGILTIAGIGVMIYLICRKLGIEDRVLITALCGIMVCFPAVTNIFGFVYTAPYYYPGAALGVLGAYYWYRKKNILSFAVCSVLMCLSTGIYQSNIPINMMVLLLFMLDEAYMRDMKWKEYIILAAKNALMCALFMAEYFITNIIFLKAKGRVMYDYKGVSSFGMTSPADYIRRIVTAYKRFIKPADYINYDGVSANMFPWNIKYFHMVLVVCVFVLAAFMLWELDRRRMVQVGLLVAVSPLFSYFIYVMVGEEDSHGGMTYGEAFMFILAAYVIERMKNSQKACIALRKISVALMLAISLLFVRYANVCYLKAYVMQSEAISYFNTLIFRMTSTEGYTKDTPIVYIGDRNKNDDGLNGTKLFDPIYLPPFQGNSLINDFAWEEMMNIWCGFSRVEGDEESVLGAAESMSVYPDSGSVKMVDGVLVVKFSD
ncbi:MAG: glucosyltransferase domain-containing protein [Lachnospiraceae bacterium]|nr:glucosyltransferase domain-containing protein [Lachnospiraceae bacterium]